MGKKQAKPKAVSRLRVFLCHSSADKPAVRVLYRRLLADGFEPWFDVEDLLPGHDWDLEIRRAVRASDVVVVCLSRSSVDKVGYVQKEIKLALDAADQQPEGSIYLIPLRLEDCRVPDRLSRWQWADLFHQNGYERLSDGLKNRAARLGITVSPGAKLLDATSSEGFFREKRPERRSAERVSLSGTNAYATVMELQAAPVIDLGLGGVSLHIEQPEKLHGTFVAVLHVPVLPPVQVKLKVVYVLPVDGNGARVGCAFLSQK